MLNQFNVSLWGDEAWAATLAVKPILQIIKIVSRDTSPPLYYLLDHLWMKIFGTSEPSIRALTFLFFLGTVWTVYFIGKLLWDEKTGLWAALLTFANPFLFKYAFEGRMYSLLTLTTTLSMYFYLKKHRLGHILSTLAALYTHHFAIFAVLVQVFWTLADQLPKISNLRKFNLKKFFFSKKSFFTDFWLIALGYLPWLYPLYYQTSLVGSGFWLAKPTLKTVLDVLGTFILGFNKSNWEKIALLLLIIILVLRNWTKEKNRTLILFSWFFLPLIFTFIVSYFFSSIFFDRYLLFVIPSAPLLLASKRRKTSLFPLIVFLAIMLSINFRYFTHPTKRPFRDFALLVKKMINNDFLINYPGSAHHLFESKYYQIKAPLYVPKGELPFYVGTALMEKNDIIREIPPVTRLGIITSDPAEKIKIEGYQPLAVFTVGDLKLIRFVPEEY